MCGDPGGSVMHNNGGQEESQVGVKGHLLQQLQEKNVLVLGELEVFSPTQQIYSVFIGVEGGKGVYHQVMPPPLSEHLTHSNVICYMFKGLKLKAFISTSMQQKSIFFGPSGMINKQQFSTKLLTSSMYLKNNILHLVFFSALSSYSTFLVRSSRIKYLMISLLRRQIF